jgi:hypothetical protein
MVTSIVSRSRRKSVLSTVTSMQNLDQHVAIVREDRAGLRGRRSQ